MKISQRNVTSTPRSFTSGAPFLILCFALLLGFTIIPATYASHDTGDATTVLVKDIIPGGASGESSAPLQLTDVFGTLFFTADDDIHGRELWKSDGTTEGTVLVEDIRPGSNNSSIKELTAVSGGNFHDIVYFTATADGTHEERKLWKSTESGTVPVVDVWPDGDSNIKNLTAVGLRLYFSANDGINGQELWTSRAFHDTGMVKNIRSDDGSSHPSELTGFNGMLFFSASDGIHGRELWKSDATEAGTVLVKDVDPDGSSRPRELTEVNGTLFFSADDDTNGRELWKSDGTAAGTELVKDIRPGADSSIPMRLTAVNDILFFTAATEFDGISRRELWKSDGTEAGTVLVKVIWPDGDARVQDLTDVNGSLFFTANDGFHGRELWKSDGTAAGTLMVKDINSNPSFPGTHGSVPQHLVDFNGTLYFGANDGHFTELDQHGLELWKSDGTEAGTVLVKDINDDTNFSGDPLGSLPQGFTVSNEILFFRATDTDHGTELWRTELVEAARTDLKVVCLHDPIYPSTSGQSVTIDTTAIDDDGNSVIVDVLEIWINDGGGPAEFFDTDTASRTFEPGDDFSYGCRARLGSRGVFSGWRGVDTQGGSSEEWHAIPILFNGPLNEKIDIVFFPDEDDYSGFSDPAFQSDVRALIREGLYTIPWFVEWQRHFNFWIGIDTANSGPDPADDSNNPRCLREPPVNFDLIYSFADSAGIVHTDVCRDNAGPPGIFTIEVDPDRMQVVAHEMGHRPFGLADEYCCDGGYRRNEPFPNLYGTEADCQSGALIRGFDPLECRGFVESNSAADDWWIFEPDFRNDSSIDPALARDLMSQVGDYKVNDSEIQRMLWMIGKCLEGRC